MAGVGDHHVHHAVRGERRLPGERLVDPARAAVGLDQQILGPGRIAERRSRHRLARRHLAGPPGGLRARRRRLRERRLVAKAARHVDAAEQHLQQMQRAAGVEAVGMGRDAAHRMHADRPADHALVAAAPDVGPGDVERDRLAERGMGELGRDPADRGGRDAGLRCDRIGAVARIEIALGQQMEHRQGPLAAPDARLAFEARPGIAVAPPGAAPAAGDPSTAAGPRHRAGTGRSPAGPGSAPPASRRWCSGRDSRHRPCRRAAARGPARARTGRRCRA